MTQRQSDSAEQLSPDDDCEQLFVQGEDRGLDALIGAASEAVVEAQMRKWDALDTSEYTPSPEFENRMQHLFKREKQRQRWRTWSRRMVKVAAVVLLTFAVLCTALTIGVEANRIQFLNSIRELGETYFHISFEESIPVPTAIGEEPGYIPAGYQKGEVTVYESDLKIEYYDENDYKIYFSRYNKEESLSLTFDSEHQKPPYEIQIGNYEVTVYEALEEGYVSYVHWETEVQFYMIYGEIDYNELIQMAVSMLGN